MTTKMAKFRINADIYVEGPEIKSRNDVIDALITLLGCYDDMDDTDTSITIHPIETKRLGKYEND